MAKIVLENTSSVSIPDSNTIALYSDSQTLKMRLPGGEVGLVSPTGLIGYRNASPIVVATTASVSLDFGLFDMWGSAYLWDGAYPSYLQLKPGLWQLSWNMSMTRAAGTFTDTLGLGLTWTPDFYGNPHAFIAPPAEVFSTWSGSMSLFTAADSASQITLANTSDSDISIDYLAFSVYCIGTSTELVFNGNV